MLRWFAPVFPESHSVSLCSVVGSARLDACFIRPEIRYFSVIIFLTDCEKPYLSRLFVHWLVKNPSSYCILFLDTIGQTVIFVHASFLLLFFVCLPAVLSRTLITESVQWVFLQTSWFSSCMAMSRCSVDSNAIVFPTDSIRFSFFHIFHYFFTAMSHFPLFTHSRSSLGVSYFQPAV